MIEFRYTNPPDDFFHEEIRSGHLVTTQIKTLWAIEMDLLQAYMNVCQEAGLHFWIEGGTLLGCARHGGFIPWDDDIDICMTRKDYDKFVELGLAGVFPEPLFFQSYHNQPMMGKLFSRLRLSGTTMITTTRSTRYPELCHNGVFIDIFPMDAIKGDNDQEFKDNHYMRIGRYKMLIEKEWVESGKNIGPAQLSRLLERAHQIENIMLKYKNAPDTKNIATLATTMNYSRTRRVLADVLDTEWVPFEYIQVPRPKNYRPMLDLQYPDWETVYAKTGKRHSLVLLDLENDSIIYKGRWDEELERPKIGRPNIY